MMNVIFSTWDLPLLPRVVSSDILQCTNLNGMSPEIRASNIVSSKDFWETPVGVKMVSIFLTVTAVEAPGRGSCGPPAGTWFRKWSGISWHFVLWEIKFSDLPRNSTWQVLHLAWYRRWLSTGSCDFLNPSHVRLQAFFPENCGSVKMILIGSLCSSGSMSYCNMDEREA